MKSSWWTFLFAFLLAELFISYISPVSSNAEQFIPARLPSSAALKMRKSSRFDSAGADADFSQQHQGEEHTENWGSGNHEYNGLEKHTQYDGNDWERTEHGRRGIFQKRDQGGRRGNSKSSVQNSWGQGRSKVNGKSALHDGNQWRRGAQKLKFGKHAKYQDGDFDTWGANKKKAKSAEVSLGKDAGGKRKITQGTDAFGAIGGIQNWGWKTDDDFKSNYQGRSPENDFNSDESTDEHAHENGINVGGQMYENDFNSEGLSNVNGFNSRDVHREHDFNSGGRSQEDREYHEGGDSHYDSFNNNEGQEGQRNYGRSRDTDINGEKLPETCFCKSEGEAKGKCYFYTDDNEKYCSFRKCFAKFICVEKRDAKGMTCLLHKNTVRIVPTGSGTCKTQDTDGYMYVPYI